MTQRPNIRRVRHELHRRDLTITSTERLTPHMIRITLSGDDLPGFISDSFDDHIKITLPGNSDTPQRREYTPRRYDPVNNQLVLDFFDHAGGPAADWASAARPGDRVQIGGPRGSAVIEGPIAHWLLIGDETALPAIGRKLEELAPDTAATTLVAVSDAKDEQDLTSPGNVRLQWIHRPETEAASVAPFISALGSLSIPENCFVWIAAEARVAKEIREWFLGQGYDKSWMKAAGYWVAGQADSSVKSIDD